MATTLTSDTTRSAATDPLGRRFGERERATSAAVLVATNGGASSMAAIRIAAALARRDNAPLEVLTVEEELSAAVRGFTLDASTLDAEPVRRSGVLARIREQLRAVLGNEGWRLRVEFGRAAQTIARAARDLEARIIVVGLGKGLPTERFFGRETAARVLRYATVPVLAVQPSATELPHRAAIALDFSEPSLRAAREAAALVEPPGALHLLHVSSAAQTELPESEGWKLVYDTGVQATFERLEKELARPGVMVKSRLLTGTVSEQLADFARKEGIDVIAAGSHSHVIADRLLLGSVPAQLLRAAECSVLVAPPKE